MIKWNEGEPPKNGKTYLMKFGNRIICSGSYRVGTLGEPQQSVPVWRCDCCGRFATPTHWAEIGEDND